MGGQDDIPSYHHKCKSRHCQTLRFMGFPPLWSRRLYSRGPQLTSAESVDAYPPSPRPWTVTRLVFIHGFTAVAFCAGGQKKGLLELHQEA